MLTSSITNDFGGVQKLSDALCIPAQVITRWPPVVPAIYQKKITSILDKKAGRRVVEHSHFEREYAGPCNFIDCIILTLALFNISEQRMSLMCGHGIGWISSVKRKGNPNIKTMEKIAKSLDVRLVDLLTVCDEVDSGN